MVLQGKWARIFHRWKTHQEWNIFMHILGVCLMQSGFLIWHQAWLCRAVPSKYLLIWCFFSFFFFFPSLKLWRNGSDTRGYFVWSFLDVIEIFGGKESSYGLYFVDMDDPRLPRLPKKSAYWYSNFLKGGKVGSDGTFELEESLGESSSDAIVSVGWNVSFLLLVFLVGSSLVHCLLSSSKCNGIKKLLLDCLTCWTNCGKNDVTFCIFKTSTSVASRSSETPVYEFQWVLYDVPRKNKEV